MDLVIEGFPTVFWSLKGIKMIGSKNECLKTKSVLAKVQKGNYPIYTDCRNQISSISYLSP